MPSTVTKSIGTSSRDYSTLQAWEDAAPADLTAVDQIWRGECYNDSEFTGTLTISGETTDATRYIELTTATGQSFKDNANVRTNGLRYNQSNGVGVNVFTNYSAPFIINIDYTRISNLQMKQQGAGGGMTLPSHGFLKDIIFHNDGATLGISTANGDFALYNLLYVCINASGNAIALGTTFGGTSTMEGCTIVRTSNRTASGTGVATGASGNGHVMRSCAIFGFSTAASATGFTTATNNATDQASLPGSSNQTSVTYSGSTPFASATGTLDFKAVASTSLAVNGFLDATNAPNDISGLARASSPTIGAWELAAAGGGVIPNKQYMTNVAVKTASLW